MDIIAQSDAAGKAVARLERLAELVTTRGAAPLEVAIRAWAAHDALVRSFQQRVDARRIGYLSELMHTLITDPTEASVFAQLIYTVFVDVEGTERLLAASRAAGVRHLVYISIVGVDEIPLAYYRHKLAAEALVAQGAVPWSIQRTPQFHPFLDRLLCQAARLPLLVLPTDTQVQPVDTDEVAARLRELVASGPQGRVADMGGPEVLTLGEAARCWRKARRVGKALVHLPLVGALGRALRRGALACPDHRDGGVTWSDWLARSALDRTGSCRKEAADAGWG